MLVIVREQHALFSEASFALAEAVVQINTLKAEEVHLSSELVEAKDKVFSLNSNLTANTQENENLKSTITEKDVVISAKDATIAQLQQARTGGGNQPGEVYRLTQELKRANEAVNLNADLADDMKAKAEASALEVESMKNPLAQGSTFSYVVDVMKAAACATKSGPNYTWDHVECEELVRTMVEGMVAVSAGAKRAKTVNDMVVQVVFVFILPCFQALT